MRTAAVLFCFATAWAQQTAAPAGTSITLFDGKTLDGWRGDPDWWSVRDGEIVGKFSGRVPATFLYTNGSYSDFRLMLLTRMTVPLQKQAGECIWSEMADRGETSLYAPGPLGVFPKPGIWDYIDAKGIRVYIISQPKNTVGSGSRSWRKGIACGPLLMACR